STSNSPNRELVSPNASFTINPDENIATAELESTNKLPGEFVSTPMTSGLPAPAKLSSSVLKVFSVPLGCDVIATEFTANDCGALDTVAELIVTALKLGFAMNIDCELPGTIPSDHDVGSPQLPLDRLIQEFNVPE